MPSFIEIEARKAQREAEHIWLSECAWMKCYRVYFSIWKCDWEDCPNGIIRGISFESDLSIRYPMGKDRSRKKSSFESVKGVLPFIIKIPFIALASKASKRNDYIRVVVDKVMIEIGKAKKFLNVIDHSGFGPVLYSLNFGWIHGEAFRW